jgi:hypothetical protein
MLMLLLALLASATLQASPGFQHDMESGPRPWTGEHFDAAADKFTFAIFADITGGERDGVFDVAVAQLRLLRPEFIVNVGDLIEGADDRAEVDRQWDVFEERAGKTRAPVFYVGGNHDLLGAKLQQAWGDRLGPSYYHFVYKDTLFLVLDTEDHSPERLAEMAELRRQAFRIADERGWDAFDETDYAKLPENPAGNISAEQSAYFLEAIAANPEVRHTFLFMHKAPWLREDLETFATIEAALADRPYTVFHGHEHGYRYEQRHGRDYIQLATSGGVFLPENGGAFDHLVWVTVDGQQVDIATLKMSGILDRTGKLPGRGAELCLEHEDCADD